jgi:hypothetical protein
MDIAELKPVERFVDILHPVTDKPIGVRVSLVSFADKSLKKTKHRLINEQTDRNKRGKTIKADEIEENSIDLTFAAMRGWDWTKGDDGKPATFKGEKPEFTKPNVEKVFDELPWFQTQVEEAISDEKAFFTKLK